MILSDSIYLIMNVYHWNFKLENQPKKNPKYRLRNYSLTNFRTRYDIATYYY
jgi:hypothetical protein